MELATVPHSPASQPLSPSRSTPPGLYETLPALPFNSPFRSHSVFQQDGGGATGGGLTTSPTSSPQERQSHLQILRGRAVHVGKGSPGPGCLEPGHTGLAVSSFFLEATLSGGSAWVGLEWLKNASGAWK